MLAFSSNGRKDSATFATEIDEFVWNLVTFELREQMNETSAPLPRGSSEFERAGLEMAPSRIVSPPRVAAAACSMECRVVHHLELHDTEGRPIDQHLVDRPGRRRPPRRDAPRRLRGRHGGASPGRALRRPRRLYGRRGALSDDAPERLRAWRRFRRARPTPGRRSAASSRAAAAASAPRGRADDGLGAAGRSGTAAM